MNFITNIIDKRVAEIVDKKISERINEIIDSIIELNPDGSYIIVLPDDIDKDIVNELVNAFESINTSSNILVVQASGIKIIDLS